MPDVFSIRHTTGENQVEPVVSEPLTLTLGAIDDTAVGTLALQFRLSPP